MTMGLAMARAVAEDFLLFCQTFALRLYLWQQESFGTACARREGRFVSPLAAVSAPRGNGKSQGAAWAAGWRFRFGPPPQTILSVGLNVDGAKVILDHARRMFRECATLAEGVEEYADGFKIPSVGSRWIVRARDRESSQGEHPSIVTYDETGWAKDGELFASLSAAQASVVDPLMLLTSTVGRRQAGPLWRVKELAEAGAPGVCWWHTTENGSPRVTPEFLARQRRILLAGQYAMEHENRWTDAADSFAVAADVDAAMGYGWTEQLEGEPGVRYVMFVDLGAVHDPTVIAVGHQDEDATYIDRIQTYQGSREQPVQLAVVESAVRSLAAQFPMDLIRIESWQGLAAVQSLLRYGLPVTLFTPTAKTNSEEWPILAQRLVSRRLVLPPHARLREELLGLSYAVGPTGIRVTDKGQIHQDHAVAVRGVCASLTLPVHEPARVW